MGGTEELTANISINRRELAAAVDLLCFATSRGVRTAVIISDSSYVVSGFRALNEGRMPEHPQGHVV